MARILIILALLLGAVPVSFAQPLFTANGTSVVIGSSACNDFQNVAVSGGGTAIPFTAAINYAIGDTHGNWLYATVSGSGSTSSGAAFSAKTGASGVTLTIGLNAAIGAASVIAQVILTPTNSPASAPIAITVSYSQNIGCGGNAGAVTNNDITVTPGNVALTANPNGTQSQTVTIRNLLDSPLSFGYSLSPNQWLSATANATTIAPNGTTSITLTGDGAKVSSSGTYFESVTIAPGSGFGAAITIMVIFTVTAGANSGSNSSGTLTLNGTTSNTYSTTFNEVGGSSPAPQCLPLEDSAANANSYSYAVSTGSGGSWLLANFNLSGTTTGLIGPSSNACVDLSIAPNVASTLSGGVYNGSVLLTSSSGSTATISVTLYISGGVAPGVTVSPVPVLSFFNQAVGSTLLQQELFSFTVANGYQLGTARQVNATGCLANSSWFVLTDPIVSGNTVSFGGTANPTGLQAGVYCTLLTMPSTGIDGNASGTSYILIVLPVGQGDGGTGGNTGGTPTSLVAPTALTFQQQSGSSFWTSGREAQTITITGQPGTPWSASITYGSGGANWLNFESPVPASGTFGDGPASLTVDLYNGITSLSPSSTPYTATVSISTPGGTSTVGVSLLVTPANTPVLLALPASVTFNTTSGVPFASQGVQIVGSDNTTSTTGPIIHAGTPTVAWATAYTSGNSLDIQALNNSTGFFYGTIPITAIGYANSLNYPVVLVGNGGGNSAGPLTLSALSFTFANVTGQSSQTFKVTAAGATTVNASFTETTCATSNWLAISPGGTFTATPVATPIAMTVNASGLANGASCAGLVSLATSSATQVVSVTMTVGIAGSLPQLSLKLAADFATVQPGAALGYTATVSNSAAPATGTATAVTLTDPLPTAGEVNWSIVPAYSGPGLCAIMGPTGSQVLGCSFGDMAPAATASVHVSSVTAPANCGTYSNTATLAAGNNVALQWSAATAVPCAQLFINNTAAGAFHQAQNGVSYTVSIGNAYFAGPTTGMVTVTEALPDGLHLVSMAGTGWTCSGLTCARNDPLMPTATYPSITVTVNVAATAPSQLNNQAAVSGGGSPAASASALTTIVLFTCDINNDGATTVADVQLEINQALGVTPSANDLNHDSVVNVADVQKLINAALGLGCPY